MYWDEKAAIQGLPESQNDLASMLLHGDGGHVDVERAIYWYLQSAEKDCNAPYAQWASESLERIFSGVYSEKYRDDLKREYWAERGKHLENIMGHSHPLWFYKQYSYNHTILPRAMELHNE